MVHGAAALAHALRSIIVNCSNRLATMAGRTLDIGGHNGQCQELSGQVFDIICARSCDVLGLALMSLNAQQNDALKFQLAQLLEYDEPAAFVATLQRLAARKAFLASRAPNYDAA